MHFKILVIQSDTHEAKISADRFHAFGCEVLAIGHSGKEAINLAQTLQPNVLIMDAFLPGYNCEEITEILEKKLNFPLVKIAISRCRNDTMANRFFNSGGDLFLMTPLDYSFSVRRMETFYRLRISQGNPLCRDAQIRNCAKKILLNMQMPMTIHGFIYILDAVELVAQNSNLLQNVVHGLYTAIGEIRGQQPGNVERCIRTAIEKVFEQGDMDYIFPLFGHAVKPRTGRPSNTDFIAQLSDIVNNELASGGRLTL